MQCVEKGLLMEMSTYQKRKQELRNQAIEWQLDFENHNYSWMELGYWQSYFRTLGKRYGLLTEFRENGIC